VPVPGPELLPVFAAAALREEIFERKRYMKPVAFDGMPTPGDC